MRRAEITSYFFLIPPYYFVPNSGLRQNALTLEDKISLKKRSQSAHSLCTPWHMRKALRVCSWNEPRKNPAASAIDIHWHIWTHRNLLWDEGLDSSFLVVLDSSFFFGRYVYVLVYMNDRGKLIPATFIGALGIPECYCALQRLSSSFHPGGRKVERSVLSCYSSSYCCYAVAAAG